jgi:putative PIN family toxin of toxin-antitoxin system
VPPRAVYDAMVMLQWAALPQAGRQHATVTALTSGRVRLAMSQRLLDEVRGIYFRPELQQRFPSLTPQHAAAILKKTLELADWFETVPARFSLAQHPKDNHLFDLAIEAHAEYLVTWEARLLKLQTSESPEARNIRLLAPALKILTPKELADALKLTPPQP